VTLWPPSGAEQALVAAARDLLVRHRRPELRTVVAGVLAGSGTTYFGVNLVSRASSVCAEPAALSAAFLAGEETITSVVAVCFLPDLSRVVVINPCGACRELLHAQSPGCRVVIRDEPGDLVAVPVEHLFPMPDLFFPSERPAPA
jgi:cytidine deaminase